MRIYQEFEFISFLHVTIIKSRIKFNGILYFRQKARIFSFFFFFILEAEYRSNEEYIDIATREPAIRTCTYNVIGCATRSQLVSIRITVTPDHPQFYHPPSRKDSNFLLPACGFLSTSPAPRSFLALPLSCSLSLSLFLPAVHFFFTVHGLNLCLIADYWDFARMRKKRGDRETRSVRLSSPRDRLTKLGNYRQGQVFNSFPSQLRVFFRIGESTDYSRCETSKFERTASILNVR